MTGSEGSIGRCNRCAQDVKNITENVGRARAGVGRAAYLLRAFRLNNIIYYLRISFSRPDRQPTCKMFDKCCYLL